MNHLTEEFANKVYDLLVNIGGAKESERIDFIYSHCIDTYGCCIEWRFQGKLGFGGKYKSTWNGVMCYSEDETTKRIKVIKELNEELKKLK